MKHLIINGILTYFFLGCASLHQDYTNFKAHMPRSILVLPPTNNTNEVDASGAYLSIVSRPVAEKGFYVYPVVLVDQFMKDNGISSPAEMHQLPLSKLFKVFAADAILYIEIDEWGNSFEIIDSKTVIKARVRLVDAKTGKILWAQAQHAVKRSNSQGGLLGAIVSAAVTQVINESTDAARQFARSATFRLINHEKVGFLDGPLKELKSDQSGSKKSS